MDYQFYGQQQNPRRSGRMEFYSMALGIIALVTFCTLYSPFICGSLAIVFALLSRGGEAAFAPRARAGLITGSVALGLVVFLCIFSVVYVLALYGSIENMLIQTEDIVRPMYERFGIDYDMLLQSYR